MQLEFVPLFQIQRDLYRMPRGMERFREYLRTMVDTDTGDLSLPLVAMNPMAKNHVPALLDTLLGFEADALAAATLESMGVQLRKEPGQFRVGLVVADDAGGGWTNRYCSEFTHRFEEMPLYKRGWITGIIWTSEQPNETAVREEVLSAVHRAAYVLQRGVATTLGGMLDQEGVAMVLAGCAEPVLGEDDLAYTREVIRPLLAATDHATVMACLFGDEAATALGYQPQGLSHRAGLALALHQARSSVSSSGMVLTVPSTYSLRAPAPSSEAGVLAQAATAP